MKTIFVKEYIWEIRTGNPSLARKIVLNDTPSCIDPRGKANVLPVLEFLCHGAGILLQNVGRDDGRTVLDCSKLLNEHPDVERVQEDQLTRGILSQEYIFPV